MERFHPTRGLPTSRARVRSFPVDACVLAIVSVVTSSLVPSASRADEHAEPSPPAQSPVVPTPAEEERALEAATPFRQGLGAGADPQADIPDEGAPSTHDVPTPAEVAEAAEAEETPEPPKRIRFTGFPFVYYLPETSVGFGFGIGLSALTAAPPEGSRYLWFPSNLTVGGAYTIRRQLRILVTPELYLRRGRLVIDGLTEARIYPDRFYGLGRDTDANYQRYTEVSFRTSTAFRYQFRPGLYVGGVFDAAYTRLRNVADEDSRGVPMPDAPSDQWLGTGAVPGEDGSQILGFGATFVLDRRDFPLMSRSGYYVRVVGVGFPGGGPFTHRFFRSLAEVRGFVPFLGGKLVLAGQWLFSGVVGDAPFNSLASVGGPVGLRSYPDGRFRDAAQTFLQAELRFPLFWRFRGAFHVGTGTVFGPSSQGRRYEQLWAVGLGLRLVVFEDRRIAVRGDLVLGPEGLRVMAFIHEAF